jgi:hypothetical protein
MKTARISTITVLILGFTAWPAQGQLTLPYYGLTSTPEKAFWVSNNYAGAGSTYGGFFYSAGQEGRGVFGQCDGITGFGVKGWAKNGGNAVNYGGHFCATGQQGVGVYGWAENTGNVINYGGKFLAEGIQGVGIHAKGGANGYAGIFEGDIKIPAAGKGIIFPDGTRQTTAGGGGSNGWTVSGYNVYSAASSNVGIGTTTPQTLLQLGDHPGPDFMIGATYPLEITHAEGGTGAGDVFIKTHPSAKWGKIVFQTKNNTLFDGNQLVLSPDGNVGVGTLTPFARLDVVGSSEAIRGSASGKNAIGVRSYVNYVGAEGNIDDKPDNYAGHFVAEGKAWQNRGPSFPGGYSTGYGVGVYAKGGAYAAILDGRVEIKNDTSVYGHIRIKDNAGSTLVDLGEGLDYAEGFDVTDTREIGPGSVLVIDPRNAGHLTLSTTVYDTKVAGIVAGAKSLGSGVRLGTSQFDKDVALAGRVYCNVDATETAVVPGDLLTTSATPGFAMKASDHVRAQGAILGKAMESLEQGKKGQILVLVTLQ